MPTYQYRCKNCSHEFEEFQSMKDSPLVTCPNCKQDQLQRIIGSGGGMIFKGSGFYLTDYKGNSSTKGSSAEKKPESKKTDSSAGNTSGGETKPDKSSSTDTNKKAAQ